MSKLTKDMNTFNISRWIFLRGLAIVFLIAFVSAGAQVQGLIGSEGILPAKGFLAAIYDKIGIRAVFMMPTVFWLNASDFLLSAVCIGGVIFSIILFIGWMEVVAIALLWFLYLSLVNVGQVFFSYQWDVFLLEVGFLSIFLAPEIIQKKTARKRPPSKVVIFLIYWVLFRIMFESGVVKLMSGDVAWRNMSALSYHFFTQPIPNAMSWMAHHLPDWMLRISTFMMFVIELIIPFLIFMGRRARLVAFFSIVGLMGMISLTGNYTFFNLFTVIICFLLLDDHVYKKFIPDWILERADDVATARKDDTFAVGRLIMLVILTVFIVTVSTAQLFQMIFRSQRIFPPIQKIMQYTQPYHLVNRYGLFAVMTKERPEIIVEGSYDGNIWKAYQFPWKPGDVKRPPGQAAPHQPRLDWQMWFAALGGDFRSNQWFLPFVQRLLEGSKPVVQLLENNPFEGNPPKFIRAGLYKYRFASPEEKRKTGQVWNRELLGVYCPPVSLK